MSRRRSTRLTSDSFVNFAANLGLGAGNIASAATYGFNPISRNRQLIEWAYRGSWIVRKTIECPAEDMTRQGTSVNDDMPPDRIDAIQAFWGKRQLWARLCSTLKWARLYGGCLAIVVIDGQKFDTPLRMSSVGKGQFKGLFVLDRWMVTPDYDRLVSDPGSADYGDPMYYDVVADARTLPNMRIHHSRCLRFDGIELPYWQKIAENGWGLSVLEPLWDRLVAFDSTTQGAAQLVYKAHLRTLYLPDLRNAIAAGGKAYQNILKQVNLIRMLQSNEGMSILDAGDRLEAQQYAFNGLSDMIAQFGQQLSGSADVPLTRMFGQSPAGMNATGESDLRNYYDGLHSQQENKLREPVQTLYEVTHRSLYGEDLPPEFGFTFNPLWQLTDEAKVSIAGQVTSSVTQAFEAQIISAPAAAKELRQVSRMTGVFSNITDEDIEELEANPPHPGEDGDAPGMEGLGAPDDQGFDDADALTDPGQRPASNATSRIGSAAERLAEILRENAPAAERLAAWLEERQDAGPTNAERLATLVGEGSGNTAQRLADLLAGREGATNAERLAQFVTTRRPRRSDAVRLAELLESRQGGDVPAATEPRLGLHTRDAYPVREFHGLQLVIETPRGHRRVGNGWAVQMPTDYGYISGTSSAEGPQEQMDCYVGPDLTAPNVWVIDQRNIGTGTFDEHKVMIGFPSRDEARAAYIAAFNDGHGPDRIMKIREVPATELSSWLQSWRYGQDDGLPFEVNGVS